MKATSIGFFFSCRIPWTNPVPLELKNRSANRGAHTHTPLGNPNRPLEDPIPNDHADTVNEKHQHLSNYRVLLRRITVVVDYVFVNDRPQDMNTSNEKRLSTMPKSPAPLPYRLQSAEKPHAPTRSIYIKFLSLLALRFQRKYLIWPHIMLIFLSPLAKELDTLVFLLSIYRFLLKWFSVLKPLIRVCAPYRVACLTHRIGWESAT